MNLLELSCTSVFWRKRSYPWRIQGRGRGPAPAPPLFLDQTEARRAEKNCFGDHPTPLSKGLDDRPAPPIPISRAGSGTAYALIKFASLKKNFPEFRLREHTQKKDVEVWQKNFRPVSRVKFSMQILTVFCLLEPPVGVLTCQECGSGLCMCFFQTLSMVFNILLKISRHGSKRGMWCKTFRGIYHI